jgi:NitT/TauT family transport system substrate-binding protein
MVITQSRRHLQTRRRFLANLSIASAAGIAGLPGPVNADPAPETTTVRFVRWFDEPCAAPQNAASELLRAEGFTDIRYLQTDERPSALMARGEVDFGYEFGAAFVSAIEAGRPIMVLAGLHSGCLELIANETINSVKDLRGKMVGTPGPGSSAEYLLKIMLAYLGVDPANDIEWAWDENIPPADLFEAGEIDAFLGFPPAPQDFRARGIGHTILNTGIDRPWSHYYCCMLAGRAEFVEKYPAATKRVMRAILKTADLCASQPDLVARSIVDGGLAARYDYTLEALRSARYDRWREFDPADTLRFYALQMYEAGLISSPPNTIIANGTNWRFLDEIRSELRT